MDARTAQRWMRFAKNADAVLVKCATSADLTFAEIDRDLSVAAAASVSDDLEEVAEKVAGIRDYGGTLADVLALEVKWQANAERIANRKRRYQDNWRR